MSWKFIYTSSSKLSNWTFKASKWYFFLSRVFLEWIRFLSRLQAQNAVIINHTYYQFLLYHLWSRSSSDNFLLLPSDVEKKVEVEEHCEASVLKLLELPTWSTCKSIFDSSIYSFPILSFSVKSFTALLHTYLRFQKTLHNCWPDKSQYPTQLNS